MKTSFGIGINKNDAKLCVAEAVNNFESPQLILFFSGEKYFPEYASIIHKMYPDAVTIGCSTYRTANKFGTEKDTLNVIAIESGIVCSAGIIEKADNFALGSAGCVKKCMEEVGITENTICMEFTVPFKRAEEFALMVLNSVLLRNEIPVIGGTAANISADTNGSYEAYVALNGKVYTEGCVFALIHNNSGKIHIYRENIYEPLTGRELIVTKANNLTRTVMTYNDIPACETYSNELGVPEEKISEYFFNYPMGRWDGDEIFITAIQEIGSGGSMKHFARIHEGTKVMVMKEGDYKKITAQTIENIKNEVKSASFVFGVHCVARTVLFEQNGYINEYQQLLADAFPNFIVFSALGEQMGTNHFNHTMMIVVFE